jgi:TatD DNase family protein
MSLEPLSSVYPLIDSHAHLQLEPLASHREQVLQGAAEVGIEQIISVGVDVPSSHAVVQMARELPGKIWAAAGISPHYPERVSADEWAALEELWQEPCVVAVGETGLDYFYDFSPRELQRELFTRQLEASGTHNVPIVLHVRDAFEDVFNVIKAVELPAGGVMHCFTGGPKECERALELGLYLSFSGIVTFLNADLLREAARLVPADRLLLETDAPYLAPVPLRGKPNQPAYLIHTARRLAEIRQVEVCALCHQTRLNTCHLFGLPSCQPNTATIE